MHQCNIIQMGGVGTPLGVSAVDDEALAVASASVGREGDVSQKCAIDN